jgi:hypothetical protein
MSPKHTPRASKPSTSSNILFAVAVVAVVGVGAYMFMKPSAPEAAATTTAEAADAQRASTAAGQNFGTAPAKTGHPETQPLPELFLDQFSSARPVDQVRAVYEFSAEHPEVLQYVPCFCGCEARGHSGNDDCFVQARDADGRVLAWEPHGMACAVCIDVGADASRMYASGASVTQIRDAIETKYRPLAASMTPTPMPEGHAGH